MPLTDEFEDVLKKIEHAVVEHWKQHDEMNNYNVMRAYEIATAHYHAIARGQTPKPESLKGLDASLYQAVHAACEARLNQPIQDSDSQSRFLTMEDLVACLRRLRKSVERWTKEGGRQGYLQFVAQFLP